MRAARVGNCNGTHGSGHSLIARAMDRSRAGERSPVTTVAMSGGVAWSSGQADRGSSTAANPPCNWPSVDNCQTTWCREILIRRLSPASSQLSPAALRQWRQHERHPACRTSPGLIDSYRRW